MNLTKRLDVALDPEEYERIQNGNPLQIPTDNALIVLYPPEGETDNQRGIGEGEQ